MTVREVNCHAREVDKTKGGVQVKPVRVRKARRSGTCAVCRRYITIGQLVASVRGDPWHCLAHVTKEQAGGPPTVQYGDSAAGQDRPHLSPAQMTDREDRAMHGIDIDEVEGHADDGLPVCLLPGAWPAAPGRGTEHTVPARKETPDEPR